MLTVESVFADSYPKPAKFCPRLATAAMVLVKSSSCEEFNDCNVGKVKIVYSIISSRIDFTGTLQSMNTHQHCCKATEILWSPINLLDQILKFTDSHMKADIRLFDLFAIL